MKIEKPDDYSIDIGPMGAIGEQGSLLLRINRNCPWNKCLFCSTYKNKKFEYRNRDEVIRDIELVKVLSDEIKKASLKLGWAGDVNDVIVSAIVSGNPRVYGEGSVDPEILYSRYAGLSLIANWLSFGGKTVFLQDANALIMRTHELVEVIRCLKESFPSIERITSYARSKTCAKKSIGELKELYDAGLSRVLVGLESGYDPVLEYMQKGVTAEEHIKGGRNIVESGIQLVEFVMPGLGGRQYSERHILETARVLNEIKPDLIRIRSLAIQEDSPLYERYEASEFEWPTDDQMVDEIELLIENLNFECEIETGQLTNILFEIKGKLPQEKEEILKIINRYQAMPPDEKLRFRFYRYARYYLPYVVKRGRVDYQLEQLVEEAQESLEKESQDAETIVEQAILTMKSRCIP